MYIIEQRKYECKNSNNQKSINTSFDADGVVIIKRKKIMKIENKGTLLGKGKSGGYGYETKKVGLIILAVGASVFFSSCSYKNFEDSLRNLNMEANSSFSKFPIQFSVMMLFLPCLLSIGNSLILLVLTLFLKPVLSYGIMIIFLLCGAYFNSMFWWESLTMALRSEWVVQGGYTMFHATILGGVVIIGAWIVGGIYFQKYDILNLDSE